MLERNKDALEVINDALSIASLPSFGLFIKAGIEERLNLSGQAAESYRHLLKVADESEAELVAYAKERLRKLR